MPLLVWLLHTVRRTQPGGKQVLRWGMAAVHALSMYSLPARKAAVDAGALAVMSELRFDCTHPPSPPQLSHAQHALRTVPSPTPWLAGWCAHASLPAPLRRGSA